MPRKQRAGVVVSDKMDKTVVVQVERTVTHPRYGKTLRRRKRYKAHDETNVCRLGDRVLIEEARPLSKQKHWRVREILDRREVAALQPREIDAELSGSAPRGFAPPAPSLAEPAEPAPPPSAAEPTTASEPEEALSSDEPTVESPEEPA